MKKYFIISAVVLILGFGGYVGAEEMYYRLSGSDVENIVSKVLTWNGEGNTQEEIVTKVMEEIESKKIVRNNSDDDDDKRMKLAKRMNFGQFKKFLRQGSSGDDVKDLQEALNEFSEENGLTFNWLTPDGVYGPATAQAVRIFQAHKKLSSDGVVGPNTLENLKNFLEGKAEYHDDDDDQGSESDDQDDDDEDEDSDDDSDDDDDDQS